MASQPLVDSLVFLVLRNFKFRIQKDGDYNRTIENDKNQAKILYFDYLLFINHPFFEFSNL